MSMQHLSLFAGAILISACASTPYSSETSAEPVFESVANRHFQKVASAADKREKDRLAILAMQGEYRVDFHFQETVLLADDYESQTNKTTGGYETVFVVEESADRVILQHLLVTPGGHVIKHWRQDWFYEARERFEFVSDQTWRMTALDPNEAAGTWTQCVYEVSDAPRYCGTGLWNHRYGVSTWTSDRSWRPLPRREYTTREDYNAINAENRHTITPHGWTHEQDNTKTVREGEKTARTLVREFGFNDYRNISGFDFSPAAEYWSRTSNYWAKVRDAWTQRLQSGMVLQLTTDVDGMPIIVGTFAQAENIDEMSEAQQVEAINTLLDTWTESRTLVSQR